MEQPLAKNTMSPLQVVCGLVWREGLFFAARKKPGKANAGFWELPGGKVGEGELVEQALVREFREELGMELRPGKVLGSVEQLGEVSLFLVAIEASCGDAEPAHCLDHDAAAWVSPGHWKRLHWCENDRRLLGLIFQDLEGGNGL
ncbi:MAG: NUDIX domain-containing protein [Flavobacteriales bacterium]